MAGMEINDLVRIVLITFIISLLVISVALLLQKKRCNLVNGFTLSMISAISVIVSGTNLMIMGYIADEFNLSGDAMSTYMFLIILGLNILNFLIYLKKE
ncbi:MULTISPECIES: hypothetical protein [Brevibacillus]|uniref:hypothetical protein n=1 Tax=Brevibacillus TaxID=55080 RepID=UPI000D109156|nr:MULTISPECIES: hypothetical protein [Brevibacillus]PSJ69564.1 hypothetical protein C7J99_09145 [Brevibacillus brevis]RED23095.1 hypothetical protein DES34_11569 [Brevibacillus brevis]TQK45730.1 hypothetical protein FB479_113119 [Brevibacillus sp. AG162]VEF87477.1 Uncharacterised protein [Brevibacillus brevis]GEC89644.1 hypothetical protein BBR01nite_19750 [Brevibacillus brevis]